VAEILGVDVEVKELDIVWVEEPAAIASFARRSENAS
jgi:tRNA U54 and U55 pseudouridine synthase Pus10